jgi:hypothetical protein
MHCQVERSQALSHNSTTWLRFVEPQNPRIFVEFLKAGDRQECAATRCVCEGASGTASLSGIRRAFVKLAQIKATALLLFEYFEPRFQLLQPAS